MTLPSDLDTSQQILKKVIELLSPLKENQRRFVLVSAAAWLGDSDMLHSTLLNEDIETKHLNIQDFVFSKKTQSDAEAVAVLAYYLSEFRKQDTFKTADLDALNKEAATGQTFGNITKTVNNATQRNKYFAMVGKGQKKITPLGKMIVEALPDDEKVKALIKKYKPRSKRRKTTNHSE